MSTKLKTLKKTGSSGVELSVVRYSGGKKLGVCIQITGQMENGHIGYVQLNKKDMLNLVKIWNDAQIRR